MPELEPFVRQTPTGVEPSGSPVVTSVAPRSNISAAEVASPYQMLGNALDKVGEGLMKVAEPLAEQAGLKSVTTDANGNIKVDKVPIFGEAGATYARAMKFAAVSEGEGAAKREDIGLRQQFRDNPQGYLKAADAFKNAKIKEYSDAAGPEVGLTLGKIIDAQTTTTYRGLLNEKERLDLSRAESSIKAGISRANDARVALANGGVTSGPEWDSYTGQVKSLYGELVANPRFGVSKDAVNYEIDKSNSEMKVAAVRYHADEIEKSQGPEAALEYAKGIMTDTSLTLSDVDRRRAFDEARGVVRLNEYERRTSVQEINSDFKMLRENHADTGQLDPAGITALHKRAMDSRDPVLAAAITQFGVVASALKPMGDLPLPEQRQRIDDLKGRIMNGTAGAGTAEFVKEADRQAKQITEGLKTDGWSYFASRHPDRVQRPPALDFSNPDALAAGVAARGKIAALAQQAYQTAPVPALNAPEIAQVHSILAGADLTKKATVFQALSGLPETTRNATLAAIGGKSTTDMVQAYGGSLMASAPDLGLSIIKGATLPPEYHPKGADKAQMDVNLMAAVPATAVPYEFRGDANSPHSMLRHAIESRYADLSLSAGDVSGKLDTRRLDRASQDVTGGLVTQNGGKVFAPVRGMTQSQFDSTMAGLTDDDLRGVSAVDRRGLVSPGGEHISADYVRRNGHLESVGEGRYFVRLNSDAEAPIYAYQGAEPGNFSQPKKFVLDLRNRTPMPSTFKEDLKAAAPAPQ